MLLGSRYYLSSYTVKQSGRAARVRNSVVHARTKTSPAPYVDQALQSDVSQRFCYGVVTVIMPSFANATRVVVAINVRHSLCPRPGLLTLA